MMLRRFINPRLVSQIRHVRYLSEENTISEMLEDRNKDKYKDNYNDNNKEKDVGLIEKVAGKAVADKFAQKMIDIVSPIIAAGIVSEMNNKPFHRNYSVMIKQGQNKDEIISTDEMVNTDEFISKDKEIAKLLINTLKDVETLSAKDVDKVTIEDINTIITNLNVLDNSINNMNNIDSDGDKVTTEDINTIMTSLNVLNNNMNNMNNMNNINNNN